MKKIVFLIIACLLVLGLVIPGCTGEEENVIKILIAGPLTQVQGRDMRLGAQLARDEINNPGILVGTTIYTIELKAVDTNEIYDPAAATTELGNQIDSWNPDFIIGGVRTEAVETMIPLAIADGTPFFICAAACSLLSGSVPYPSGTGTPYYPYPGADEGYKYIFRGTPFNDVFLLNNALMMLGMVAEEIQTILGYSYPWTTGKVKIAIFAEDLAWATPMVASAQEIIADYGDDLGWELAGTWLVSDVETVEMVVDYLEEIRDAGAHIIFTILSGPVGLTYGKEYGEATQLDPPLAAMSVGINVEAQGSDYWENTKYATSPDKYGAEYQITAGLWAPNVVQTAKTAGFLSNFAGNFSVLPVYTAASYDIIYALKEAIVGKSSVAKNDIIDWLEDPAHKRTTTSGNATYYPCWDNSTQGDWQGDTWPALNTSVRDYFYLTNGYNDACNFTMPPYTTHDLVYGPGWETGIGVQWQNDGGVGKQVGVWPKADYATVSNVISRNVTGINWTGIEYTGTVLFEIPAWMVAEWTS